MKASRLRIAAACLCVLASSGCGRHGTSVVGAAKAADAPTPVNGRSVSAAMRSRGDVILAADAVRRRHGAETMATAPEARLGSFRRIVVSADDAPPHPLTRDGRTTQVVPRLVR